MSIEGEDREDRNVYLPQIRDHLRSAQSLMDRLDPYTVFGARLQHCLDDLEEMIGALEQGARQVN